MQYAKYLFSSPSPSQTENFIRDSIQDGFGITDATDAEIASLVADPLTALYQYADLISRRAQTGWSTHGHSGADVNIYASDPRAAAKLVGNHENTEVGDFLREYLDVDVEAVTRELRANRDLVVEYAGGEQVSWMGRMPAEGQRLDGQTHLSYAGDFRKRHLVHERDCGCGL